MSAASTSLHHFTWSPSADDVRIRLFEISARRAGFSTQIIRCASIDDKPRTLCRAIEDLHERALVCCTDSFDILCINKPEAVADAFRSSGRDLVFGAERSPYHHLTTSVEFFEHNQSASPYRYLNSGAIVGYAGAVREMLSEVSSWNFPAEDKSPLSNQEDDVNDQTLFGRYASLHEQKVGLDQAAAICWNLAGEWDAFVDSLQHATDPFVNPATGLRPAFLHVSHLRKYYPAYLWAARKLGLPINGSTVNLRLFDQHIEGVIPGIEGGSIEPDSETTAILRHTLEYRAMKLVDRTKLRLRRARMDLGRRRREIFHSSTA